MARVGGDLDLETGYKTTEICAVNCLRAIAAIADPDSIIRVVKVFGMANVADGFNDTSSVIKGRRIFLNAVFRAGTTHARSAVGMVLPSNWAAEVELVAELRARALAARQRVRVVTANVLGPPSPPL